MEWIIDTWQEIAVLLAGLSVLALILSTLFNGSISTPWGEINVNKKKKKQLPPHATCPHAGELMSVIARTAQLTELRNQLKYDTVEAQMRYWEERQIEAEGIILKRMGDRLMKEGVTETSGHADYIAFKAALRVVANTVKDYFRVSILRNHFTEKSPEQWKSYKEVKKQAIVHLATDLFDTFYKGNVILRSEVRDMNEEVVEDIEEMIDDVFEFALREAGKREKEWKDKYDEHEKWMRGHITG